MRAVAARASLSVDRQTPRPQDYLRQVPTLPAEDVELGGFLSSVFYAADDELRDLRAALQQLIDRFQGRIREPALRPDGARSARLFAALNLAPGETTHRDAAPSRETRRTPRTRGRPR